MSSIKSIFASGLVIIALFIVVSFVFIQCVHQLDLKAHNTAEKIIQILETSFESNNKYPENIDKFLKESNVETVANYLIFKTEIKIINNKSSMYLHYYHFPLGPFTGYNFNTKEWYNEE